MLEKDIHLKCSFSPSAEEAEMVQAGANKEREA